MKKLDRIGSKLCSYQAKIFEESLKYKCSSKIFLRRFFYSSFASKLDEYNKYIFTFDPLDCFRSLNEQYDPSNYGTKKINKEVLYWLGYITRYISYTRDYSSKKLYKNIPLDLFIKGYEVYHTQSEEWVISRMLELINKDETMFDKKILMKQILRKLWTSQKIL